MQYRYPLPLGLSTQASSFQEFANGAAQCHAVLTDGTKHSGVLISNATAIVAMRGHKEMPFSIESIDSLYQEEEDFSPSVRGNWDYFNRW